MTSKIRRFASFFTWAALLASVPGLAHAQTLALDAPFSDHAVIQRGQPVVIHGRAGPATEVFVTFAGQEQSVRSGKDGTWRASFPARQAAKGLEIAASAGEQTVVAHDVAIGDVFLCSGQSNMEFALSESALKPEDRRRPADAALHLLTIPQAQARSPRGTFGDPPLWQTASDAGASFSAICFLMGRQLAQSRGGEIGLIDASWGGTAIESWLAYEALVQSGAPREELQILDAFRENAAAAEARYGATLDARWARPARQGGRINYANLHNAMIAPLKNYGLAGAVWYQGESNANRDDTLAYRVKLEALLKSWREQFREDLPVAIIQLSSFGPLSGAPISNHWPDVREAQRQVAASDPRAALVVTSDVGERLDIHPPLKLPVAQRAARVMQALAYGEPVKLGPQVADARLDGSWITVGVNGASGRLMSASWGRPGPFVVCGIKGADRTCEFADAEFAGPGIRIAVPPGLAAEQIRYCYAAAPICNVFDDAGQPLGPFDVTLR